MEVHHENLESSSSSRFTLPHLTKLLSAVVIVNFVIVLIAAVDGLFISLNNSVIGIVVLVSIAIIFILNIGVAYLINYARVIFLGLLIVIFIIALTFVSGFLMYLSIIVIFAEIFILALDTDTVNLFKQHQ